MLVSNVRIPAFCRFNNAGLSKMSIFSRYNSGRANIMVSSVDVMHVMTIDATMRARTLSCNAQSHSSLFTVTAEI